MIIEPIDGVNIDKVVEVLCGGGLVIYPTETLYGAGVDATNPEAVKKLVRYKNRPFGKPFSVAVSNQKMAEEYVVLNDTAKNLYKRFLPGPMTIISKITTSPPSPLLNSGEGKLARGRLAHGISSELGTVGIRIPGYPLVLKLVKKLGKPITATSANASYKKRPYKIADILDNISEKQKKLIDLIIDAGKLPHNEPSTVIDTTLDGLVILRQGEVGLSAKCEVLSRGEEDTKNIGKELWQKYEKFAGQRAIVFALEGPMGAGKTQFTKGLARAMGITDEIVSPTFNLEMDYGKLIHIDAWRMQNAGELKALNFAKIITDKSVVAIEWADRVADEVRKYSEEAIIIWVKIKYGDGDRDRGISWGVIK